MFYPTNKSYLMIIININIFNNFIINKYNNFFLKMYSPFSKIFNKKNISTNNWKW